ncbi:Histone acetyltransferase HAC1 [Hibiscus syriacus]|uniref:histone acetyltransferase n=1 Tax=Hibiscus syriacus TaxID=106335 RepID=A0A6A2YBI1_HIBSY|nr:Histone acetyltransferase HAC1 [Hibiscus syriacus]
MVCSTVTKVRLGTESMTASTNVPNLQFRRPLEAESRCHFTGNNRPFRPVNEQAASHGHLPRLPFSGRNKSFCPLNEQAVSHGHLPRLPFTGQKQSFCPINEQAATHGHLPQLPFANRFYPDIEHVKRGLLRFSGKGDSGQPICGSSEVIEPLPKRLKLENPTSPCLPYSGMFYAMAPLKGQQSFSNLPPLVQSPELLESSNSEIMEVKTESLPKFIEKSTGDKEIGEDLEEVNTKWISKLMEDSSSAEEMDKDVVDSFTISATERFPGTPEAVNASYEVAETDVVGNNKEEDIDFVNGTDNSDDERDHFNKMETKFESQNQRGVSLIENFTAKQIKEHISTLRKCIDKDLGKKERENGNGISNVESNDPCQLCGEAKLSLSPAPIYCSSCCVRIRRDAMYYSIPEVIPEANGINHYLCSACYKASRSQSITASGISVSKSKLIKIKNDEEPEEWWVQCDKCKCWQHQICALFNEKKNKEGKDFVCPKCCLKEIENGERMPPPVSTVSGAKDLPRTRLSDHLEQRLSRCLQKNRQEKARATGMSIDEVPEVEGLIIREVLSVQKHVKVNEQLLDILNDQNYPAEFPYKSKVILLFQNIEGADVCLFIMYVQEYGAECGQPNQRSVYISYLDSVKYFRPETEIAASGEALRTVVYHEILVGYLDYCKKRGFATCYIWACPPRKGEDYILYCHPKSQKIPKPDKLRQWYCRHKTTLKKASKSGIVVDVTNLYDQLFSTGKYNTKVTAAHLPYFDGDYWSGAANDVIEQIKKDSKTMSMKTMSKRTLQSMGHANPSGHAIKDILLMQKLGQNILPMKEDFIIAHLQFVCVCCHRAILDGCRWSCHLCKSFQLCGRCHDAKQRTYNDSTHTLSNGEKHSLHRNMVDDVLSDTDGKDVCMDNGLFEDRYKFLFFCQKNNYQFDTLRRAKHTSMMILYYLHNPEALLATTNCCICNKDTPIDQCWHCETCSEFFVCAACYQRDGCSSHTHKLTPHSSAIDSSSENREITKTDKLSEALELLLHATRCPSLCSDSNCRLMKRLFFHSKICTVRAAGGCRHCKKTWLILKLHSTNCEESHCAVPRCRDLKLHAKALAQRDAAL